MEANTEQKSYSHRNRLPEPQIMGWEHTPDGKYFVLAMSMGS